MQPHTLILQRLVDHFGYFSYLEIGCGDGKNFQAINCPLKVCVDPDRKTPATVHMASDQYFATSHACFDLIFVDGLHHAEQVKKDIENALKVLKEGGTIMVHDCNPTSFAMQDVPRREKVWTGDGWRAWVSLRCRGDLEMFVLDTDFGCGILRRGKQDPLYWRSMDDTNYDGLKEYREEWLNLKPENYFMGWLAKQPRPDQLDLPSLHKD